MPGTSRPNRPTNTFTRQPEAAERDPLPQGRESTDAAEIAGIRIAADEHPVLVRRPGGVGTSPRVRLLVDWHSTAPRPPRGAQPPEDP